MAGELSSNRPSHGLPRLTYDKPLKVKPDPPSEVECFWWLENRCLIEEGEYFSPAKGEEGYYSRRRKEEEQRESF
jgi:hypothetical protein